MRVAAPVFNLDDFEGPLDLLLHLVENKELDIYQIVIEQVLSQYQQYLKTLSEYDLDLGAEFLSIVSSLMLLKSKTLLPADERSTEDTFDESSLRVDIIEQLVHYYKFKHVALSLAAQQEKQALCYLRGLDTGSLQALDTPTLKQTPQDILSSLFSKVLERFNHSQTRFIAEEDFKISDKIKELKQSLQTRRQLRFDEVFSFHKSKAELIALFIALLEILKQGNAKLDQQDENWIIEKVEK